MRRLFFLIMIFAPSIAFAQADFLLVEHTQTRLMVLTINWTADGAGNVTADFDSDTEQPDIPDALAGRVCVGVRTKPGTVAPSADYDIDILTPGGLSVFGTLLYDRSAIAEQAAPPLVSDETLKVFSVFPYLFVDSGLTGEVWTLSVANAGPGGQGTIYLIFR